MYRIAFLGLAAGLALQLIACGGSGNTESRNPPPTIYLLTIDSANPANGVAITASPADNNSEGSGTTAFTRSYSAGTPVTLTAPASSGGYSFVSWTGCASASGGNCEVTLNANASVTAAYNAPTITSVAITPAPSTMTVGTAQQFTASVTGTGNFNNAVNWSIQATNGSALSPGTLSATGLYTTPYPAPAAVTVTATSVQDPTQSASVTFNLISPDPFTGPALTVDFGNKTHPISPLIYGWNAFAQSPAAEAAARITVDRFGGDATSRYNYLLDVTSAASDWYFQNGTGATGVEATSQFNQQVIADKAIGAKTLGTVDVLGWVAKDGTSCSFPQSLYPNQYQFQPYGSGCGNGEYPDQTNITGNSPTLTSTPVGPIFAGNWVAYLVSQFGTAADGGVAMYNLDNEPAWWDAVHRDVHPVASTYDEVTNNGIATAKAIKTSDPTAEVAGPVIDFWWNYFYSKKDIEAGWTAGGGPCSEPWSNPLDRNAHNGAPMIEYYLQQFKAAETSFGARLLDYLDIHAYDAATYNGTGVGLTTAGDTGEQQARLNSTRAMWDPTYTDPNFPQPNYTTDSNFTANCATPLQAPQIIPMMRKWVANDYPGTKTSISEYNWGGQESINGAIAQTDLLGIFGAYGLDMATLWGPPDPAKQVPGLMAYEAFRNYDGAGSAFGDVALASTSANQAQLAVYGAQRSSDGAVTVIVLNKTYGAIASTLSLTNLTATGPAQEFLYSNANLNAIVAEPSVTLTPPPSGSTASSLSQSFPAQSITLFVIPTK